MNAAAQHVPVMPLQCVAARESVIAREIDCLPDGRDRAVDRDMLDATSAVGSVVTTKLSVPPRVCAWTAVAAIVVALTTTVVRKPRRGLAQQGLHHGRHKE
jgi:hypothetical protein